MTSRGSESSAALMDSASPVILTSRSPEPAAMRVQTRAARVEPSRHHLAGGVREMARTANVDAYSADIDSDPLEN